MYCELLLDSTGQGENPDTSFDQNILVQLQRNIKESLKDKPQSLNKEYKQSSSLNILDSDIYKDDDYMSIESNNEDISL